MSFSRDRKSTPTEELGRPSLSFIFKINHDFPALSGRKQNFAKGQHILADIAGNCCISGIKVLVHVLSLVLHVLAT